MKPSRDFTIIDVFKVLGFEPVPADTWSAGARLRDSYLSTVGKLPDKVLRPKTNGSGGHCIATYPPRWWDQAVQIVTATARHRANQASLF